MGTNIVETFLNFSLLGAEWVLWLLVVLSVVSVSIIIERMVYFMRIRIDYSQFMAELSKKLNEKDIEGAKDVCRSYSSLESRVALEGLMNSDKGSSAVEGSMEGYTVGQKQNLDRGLVVLGTLGNNAPFIGLFGTVIGIIQAFHDLAANPQGGPSAVMAGISEALVATAVGLLVAIPAVIAFNAFNRIVKGHINNAQSTMKVILTELN